MKRQDGKKEVRTTLTYNIRVYGIVQGVGFRPFVSRTCKENGITGTVANKGSYVEIFAQGDVDILQDALALFLPDLPVHGFGSILRRLLILYFYYIKPGKTPDPFFIFMD